mmetsp:Transcript_13164/g.21835  ORF Transcript_13164/g.21835 Transcript_13164/m.21835 type:complete len:104 (-) Transcript_13164:434-745(-)
MLYSYLSSKCLYMPTRFPYSGSLDVWESMAGEDGLGHSSSDSKHSQTAILEFLVLHKLNGGFILSIEELVTEAKVTSITAGSLQHFLNSNPRSHLDSTDNKTN